MIKIICQHPVIITFCNDLHEHFDIFFSVNNSFISADHAFLFRTQKIGMPKGLCKIMASHDILTIGAAVRDDVRGLQRFSRFDPHGYVDLQCIAWEWGIKDKSVKKLAANILGLKVSKAQQLSNWEAETLTQAQKMYSATDAWVCLEMYRKLLNTPKSPRGVQNLEVVGQ